MAMINETIPMNAVVDFGVNFACIVSSIAHWHGCGKSIDATLILGSTWPNQVVGKDRMRCVERANAVYRPVDVERCGVAFG